MDFYVGNIFIKIKTMSQGYQGEYCLICLKTLDPELRSVSNLPCGHNFHTSCIQQWEHKMQRRKLEVTCPNCIRSPAPFDQSDKNTQNIPTSNALVQDHLDDGAQPSYRGGYRRRQNIPDCCLANQKLCLFLCSLIAVAAEVLLIYFFVSDCGDLFSEGNYPFFSAGLHAKGFIAVGVVARGVISVGIISQGLFTVSMIGTGLILFGGLWGGGLGIGVYQLGVSWYCYLGQLSISIYDSRSVQLGINLLSPCWHKEKPRFVAHDQCPDCLWF